jgi:chromate transporter
VPENLPQNEAEKHSANQVLPNQSTYDKLDPVEQKQRLKQLAVVFLKLGTIAFGGPAAHIAMMDEEVVSRRQWLSRERLLDLLGVTNLIPGPNSTELAIHIGYERAGWRGLIVAGICFILPALLIVWTLAVVYQRYQTVPEVEWLLYGVKPVIVAVVLQALWQLGRKAAKDWLTTAAGVTTAIGAFAGVNEIALLLLIGTAVMLIRRMQQRGAITGLYFLPLTSLAQIGGTTASLSWGGVFLFFLKIGFVLYGSGYVLLAFLQRDLVERNHWLTSQQLLDAVAIGQVTPGPVFTTATFVGYLLADHAGAIAATVGIFLPAFLLIWLVNPWVSRLRQSDWTSGFLDGVNAASLGLMVTVTYTLAQTALVDSLTVIMAILSAVAVFRFKLNSAWLVLIGGAIGIAAHIYL